MGLFKAKYLKEELSLDVRCMYLSREKNPKKLRAVFEDGKLPYKLREYALQQEKDKEYLANVVRNQKEYTDFRRFALSRLDNSDLCEWILLSAEHNPSLNYDIDKSHNQIYAIYFDAAYKLYCYKKQDALKKIYQTTEFDGIKNIVLQYITDEQFLYDISMGVDGHLFVQAAITNICDNVFLKNIALSNERGAIYAVEKLTDQDCLKAVVLNVKDPYDRVRAIKKIADPSSLIEPLKNELLLELQENPFDSYSKTELLARTGDKTGRIIAFCTQGANSRLVSELRIKPVEILESDLSITYPMIKKLVASLSTDHSDRPMEIAPALSECIKALHENVLKEEIEKDIPKVVSISGEYRDYYGDGYEKSSIEAYQQTIELY